KAEIHDVRSGLASEIKDTHAGLQTEIKDVRTDLTAEAQTMRAEWRATVPALATNAEVQELRAELIGKLAEKPNRAFIVGTVATIIGLCIASAAGTVAGLQYIQPPE
uniref:hypothetical protein n=1 Tax=uncultured Rhodospira sp. TaxID=1936189 RepID=UPI0026394F70